MQSPELPPSTEGTGATYIAKVRVRLASLVQIQQAHYALQDYDAFYTESDDAPADIPPEITAEVISPDGNPIDIYAPIVTYFRPGSPYVLLQTYVGDGEDQNFDRLFSRTADGGNFGFHISHENESGLFVVPIEACGAPEPVASVAALCLGREAVEYSLRPDEGQVYALFHAAQILLDRPIAY